MESKCAYQCIRRGKRRKISLPLKVKDLTVAEIEEGDHYKYLGIDKSVGYDSPLNKHRILKEYKRRVNKLWKSELNAANKSIEHNSFAVPVITPMIGILNWMKDEIKSLDIATRRLLIMSGAFHQSSDINRLYVKRAEVGHVLKNIEYIYECRTISLLEHL